MPETVAYFLEHLYGTVDLTLTADRFTATTRGTGLADQARTVDIALPDLRQFALIPTIAAQNLVYRGKVHDTYDAEFVYSYSENGKLKKKRVFVQSEDEELQAILRELEHRCPAASLLGLDPDTAERQIGVVSAKKALYLLLALLIGGPIALMLIVQLAN
jgi:hypothetical protein